MDINEFIQRVQPRKKRSKLIPFTDQMGQLKKQGYTDLQIRDWLAENGIEVSRETVRKFIKKTNTQQSIETNNLSSDQKESSIGDVDTPTTNVGLSQADKIRKKLGEQKRDANSKRFQHDKTGNN